MQINKIGYIQKLSNLFIDDYIDLKIPGIEKRRKLYIEKIPMLKEYLGENSSFFLGNSHDSEILKINQIDNDLQVELNDVSTVDFAFAYSKMKNISLRNRKIYFPCTMIFRNIKHFSANTVSKNGKIRRESNKYLKYITEYLYEEFYSVEDHHIELALNVFLKRRRSGQYHWLLLIVCESIDVAYNFENMWIKLFGEDNVEIFNKYMADRLAGEYFNDSGKCEQYLTKHL